MALLSKLRPRSALSSRSDAELLHLTAEKGDRDAFSVFYRRHQDAVLAFVVGALQDRDLAQDVAAEVFAIAFSKVDRFDPELGNGRQWLFGIGRVAMLARARKSGQEAAMRRRLGDKDRATGEFEAAEARVDSSLSTVVAGLDSLSRRERDAVVARVVEERGYAEIAEREHATEVVVRQRVSRGLRKLARLISGEPR